MTRSSVVVGTDYIHRVHVILSEFHGGQSVVVPLSVARAGDTFREVGDVIVPPKLMFSAVWVCDLTAKKILKNKTGHRFRSHLGATQVDGTWLSQNGFTRSWPP